MDKEESSNHLTHAISARPVWYIGGMLADDRLMGSVQRYTKAGPPPSREQVAAVLHALADYTALISAVNYDPDPSDAWPAAVSVGRWLHRYGDYMEGRG